MASALATAALTSGVGATWLWLRSEAGERFLAGRIERIVTDAMVEGSLEIGELDTDLWGHLGLRDVALRDGDGTVLISVDSADVKLKLLPLLFDQRLVITDLVADRPVVTLATVDGKLNLTQLFPAGDPNAAASEDLLPLELQLRRVGVRHGEVTYNGSGVRELAIDGRVDYLSDLLGVSGLAVRGELVGDGLSGPLAVDGGLVFDYDNDRLELTQLRLQALRSRLTAHGAVNALSGDLSLGLDLLVDELAMEPIDPLLLGEAGFRGTWTGDVRVDGPLSNLQITGVLDDAVGTAGGLDVGVALDLVSDELSWQADGQLRDFELDKLLSPVTDVVRLDGAVEVSGRGTSWPDGIVIEGTLDGGAQHTYGFDLDELDGHFRIEQGVVHLSELHAITPYADLTGAGTIDITNGPMDLSLAGGLTPAGLSSMGLDGLDGRGRASLRIAGDLYADPLDLGLTGRVVIEQFKYGGLVDMQRLAADLDGRVGSEAVELSLDLVADGVSASGVVIERLTDPDISVGYRFDGTIDAAGDNLDALRLVYPGVFDISGAGGSFRFHMPPSGDYVAEVDALLGPYDLLGYDGNTGLVSATVDPTTASFDVWFQDGWRTLARTMGSYTLDTAEVELAGLAFAPIPGGTWTSDRPVRLTVVDGGLADADIAVSSPHGRLDVRGDLGTVGELAGQVRVDDLDLGYISALLALEEPLHGVLDARARLSGSASDAKLAGWVRGTAGLHELSPLGLDLVFDAADGQAELDGIFLADGAPLGSLQGTVPVVLDLSAPDLDRNGSIEATLTVDPGPLARFTDVGGVATPVGALSGVFQARGPVLDPELHARGVVQTEVTGWEDDGRIEFGVDRRGSDLALWVEGMDGYTPAATLEGTAQTALSGLFAYVLGESTEEPDWEDYDQYVSALDVQLTAEDLAVSTLTALAELDVDVGGFLRGEMHLRGGASQPYIEGDLRWLDATMGDTVLPTARVTLDHDPGLYTLDALLEFEDGGHFSTSGEIPARIDLTQPPETWAAGALDLAVEGEALPLASLVAFLPGASGAAGTLFLDGSVGGTLLDPQPDVRAQLRDGALAYTGTGVRYSNIRAEVHASSSRVSLTDLNVETSPRRGLLGLTDDLTRNVISGDVSATLDGWFPSEVSGTIRMNNAWLIALSDMQVQTSGDLSVSGTYPDLVVQGDIAVDDALVVQDLASFLTFGPIDLDERIRVHRTAYAAREEEEEVDTEPGLYESLQVDLDVNLQRNVEVQVAFPFLDDLGSVGASLTRADVQARLGGDVGFRMSEGAYSLYGPVDVLDGTMRVLQTTFELTDGSATFQGDPFDPILDLAAKSEIGTASVDLAVSGTASGPEIAFSSQQYPDQSQILTMLITGREPDTLTSDQGNAATQALVGLLLSSVLSGARLGNISYDPDGTVRIGLPVASDIYLETALATRPSIDDNVFTGQIEWALAPKIVLEVAVGNQFSWGDLFWERRF